MYNLIDMSSDSPIDINMKKINKGSTPDERNICIEKCEYTFKYPSIGSYTASNESEYISLPYSNFNFNTPPVDYNGTSYNVSEVRIYFPSLHTFNGQKADGEFIIIHNHQLSGKNLIVCTPIQKSDTIFGDSSPAMFKNLISGLKKQAPSHGEVAQINSQMNLNSIIPYKPFFSYSATSPFSRSAADFIVFTPVDNSLFIYSNDYDTITGAIISPTNYTIQAGSELYYNPNGPNVAKDNQIYIKCQPTGSSGKKKVVKGRGNNVAFASIFGNDAWWIIFNSIIFMAIVFIMYKLFYIQKSDKSLMESAVDAMADTLQAISSALDLPIAAPKTNNLNPGPK